MPEDNTEVNGTTPDPDAGKTFTQDQVNSFLADQKRKLQSSYADYEDLKAKAGQVETFESRVQELETANTELDGKVKTFETEKERAKTVAEVAEDKGVPASALRGTTREELESHADELAKLLKPSGPVIPGQERSPNKIETDPRREFLRTVLNKN